MTTRMIPDRYRSAFMQNPYYTYKYFPHEQRVTGKTNVTEMEWKTVISQNKDLLELIISF